MPILQFPTDRIVGIVEWDGSWSYENGPVLATGSVHVPDDVPISLEVQALRGKESAGPGGWTFDVAQDAVDLEFLRRLPDACIKSLDLKSGDEATFDAVAHLAPGLRRLYLAWTGFTDAALATVAKLTGLTYLQTFGNRFTDHGVRQLASLVRLDHLYLEEQTLTAAAFDFVEQLPHLTRLGLQDVAISPVELDRLRERLPGVDVG